VNRLLIALAVVGLIVLPADAIELRLRDGTVIEADSYKLTGSFLMLTLPNGQQVAYDVADVDLDALKAAEEAAKAPAEEAAPATGGSKLPRSLKLPDENEVRTGIAITDQDVDHVRKRWGDEDESGEGEQADQGPPPGYEQGGGVVLGDLRVTGQGEDRWLVEGEIINRTPRPVINVRVQLQTIAGEGESPWGGEVPVTTNLPPDETAVFSHSFTAPKPEDKLHPDVRASVIWMQAAPSNRRVPPASLSGPRAPGPVPTPEV
jgi:hypothetical protein